MADRSTTELSANMTEPIDFHIGLQIKSCRYRMNPTNNSQGGSTDIVSMPVQNANHVKMILETQ